MKKILAAAATTLAIAGSGVVMSASPASANVQCEFQGSDSACASHGYTVNSGGNQEHRVITITDNECDGHATQVKYRVQGDGSNHYVKDEDGCGGQSWAVNWVSRGLAITDMNIGEYSAGAWHYKGWVSVYSHTDV